MFTFIFLLNKFSFFDKAFKISFFFHFNYDIRINWVWIS
ncbi:MAG: hypothetical protein BAJALOKI1v1_340015 [Promethearchaeota archaeon]|nr:MAG: hypothetical protein BAJALOKI1v1_340015 [Candidatus Lokiarchaeota archaeon]